MTKTGGKEDGGGEDAATIRVAPFPFVAQMPQRLLAAGASGVIGHADRVWPDDKFMLVLENLLLRIIFGDPLGHALSEVGGSRALAGRDLSAELEAIKLGKVSDPDELAKLWARYHTLRMLVLLGDPAACLPFSAGSTTAA